MANKNEENNIFQMNLNILSSLKQVKSNIVPLENKLTDPFLINSFNNLNSLNNLNEELKFNNITKNLLVPNLNSAFTNINFYNPNYNPYNTNLSFRNNKRTTNGFFCNNENNINNYTALSYESLKSNEKYGNNNPSMALNNKYSQESFYKNNYYCNDNIFNNYNNSQLSFFLQNNNLENMDNNILNKKRKPSEKKEKKDKIDKIDKLDKLDKKILFKIDNTEKITTSKENSSKQEVKYSKVFFQCFHTKRKNKKYKNINKDYFCEHPYCEFQFKSIDQLQNHHYKMMSECQNDSILLLKLIYKTKKNLLKEIGNDEKKMKYFSDIYEKTMKNSRLQKYIDTINGTHLTDIEI